MADIIIIPNEFINYHNYIIITGIIIVVEIIIIIIGINYYYIINFGKNYTHYRKFWWEEMNYPNFV